MWCLNPTKETVKILGVHFYYNEKLEHEMNFQSYNVKIENVLRLWHTRNWTTEEKASAFTSLAISKIVYLSPITTLPLAIISQLSNIKKTLYGTGKKSKNRITLSNSYKDGGLNNADVFTKVINFWFSYKLTDTVSIEIPKVNLISDIEVLLSRYWIKLFEPLIIKNDMKRETDANIARILTLLIFL